MVDVDDGFIEGLLAAGVASEDDVVTVDGHKAWRTGSACHDPEGVLPRMYFPLVPEPRTVKNRMHLDLRVGDERRAAEVERLVGLGASRLYDGEQGPNTWTTMADPEGNESCVS